MEERFRVGSEAHKELFCRTFVETHRPFEPEAIVWPTLDDEALARLKGLPVWNEAVRTEGETAREGPDARTRSSRIPVLSEAHRPPGIRGGPSRGDHPAPHRAATASRSRPFADPAAARETPSWAFLSTGYGECIDSFFAFGLFAVGIAAGRLLPGCLYGHLRPDPAGGGAPHSLRRELGGVPARAGAGRRPRPAFDARGGVAIAARLLAPRAAGGGVSRSRIRRKGSRCRRTRLSATCRLAPFLALCLGRERSAARPLRSEAPRPWLVPGRCAPPCG